MSEFITLARPYAKAVFADALDNKLLSQWSKVLRAFSLISKDARIQQLTMNPVMTAEQRAALFFDLIQSALPQVVSGFEPRVKNFIKILAEENRLMILGEIALLYHQLLNQQKGIIEAEMISAYPIGEDHRESVQKALEARFNSKVSMTFGVDKTLIGGAIVRAGNWVMDGSVKGKLAKLAGSKL